MADVRDVDPASGHVCGNQHVNAAIGQALNAFGTLDLRHLAFKIAVVDPGVTQHFCQLVHALALTDKHDCAQRIFLLQQVFQQFDLVLKVVRAVVPLVDLLTLTGRRRG